MGASPEEEDARTCRAAVRQHVEQMRYQHCNLQRRKATFDKRFGGSNDQVEAFMKDHPLKLIPNSGELVEFPRARSELNEFQGRYSELSSGPGAGMGIMGIS